MVIQRRYQLTLCLSILVSLIAITGLAGLLAAAAQVAHAQGQDAVQRHPDPLSLAPV